MLLDEQLKSEIRKIFERPEYYGRQLSDVEVQEISEIIVALGESLVSFVKNRHTVGNIDEKVVK